MYLDLERPTAPPAGWSAETAAADRARAVAGLAESLMPTGPRGQPDKSTAPRKGPG